MALVFSTIFFFSYADAVSETKVSSVTPIVQSVPEIPIEIHEIPMLPTPVVTVAATGTNAGIEDLVRKEFSDIPVMVEISRCESRYKHYEPDGSVLRGKVNPKDVGIFQINEKYHLETAQKMGIDIHTPEGNMKYARHLYNQNGTRDWTYSRGCWGTV